MIDIHTHILPLVDDGSGSVEQSVKMVKDCIKTGVTDIILTPHYRFDFKPTKQQVEQSFEQLKSALKENGIEVGLYLGQELFASGGYKSVVQSPDFIPLNGKKVVLLEFDLEFKQDIVLTVAEIMNLGYIPIVAHFERYYYADINVAYQIKTMGAKIQVNASSIVGSNQKKYKKIIKKLFKFGLVDFVASDVHEFRENLMDKAYGFIKIKYGEEIANKLFIENAKKLLKG
jgi:protein-tyrosine phosphatase